MASRTPALKTPRGTLTEAGAREARRLRNVECWELARVAAHIGVSVQTVWSVANGRTWKWLE